MNCELLPSFFIVSFLFLVFGKTCLGLGCDSNGLSCLSCTDYQTCSGGFPSGEIISCKSGNACADDELKKCQVKLNCYALNECLQAGIFPDSMVDSNYFVCLSDGGTGFLKYDFTCQDEHFFDKSLMSCIPRSATGSAEIDSTTPAEETSPSSTEPPDPSSTSTSSTSSSTTTSSTSSSTTTSSTSTTSTSSTVPSTTTISTTPPTTTISTTPPTTTTSMSPSTTTSTPPSTSPTPTQPTTTPSPKFVCTGPGIFPNADNCKMYYRCSTSLKVFIYICPGNSYFNENILKCSMKITPACEEQILKNSTPTLPPTTSTTTPATTLPTTPSPTTTLSTTISSTTTLSTTPSSTTMSPTTPKPTATLPTIPSPITTSPTTPNTPSFSCPMPGTFQNPSNCKTYYRCSTSGKVFVYVCPGATYFNEITKRCSLTITARCKSLIQG